MFFFEKYPSNTHINFILFYSKYCNRMVARLISLGAVGGFLKFLCIGYGGGWNGWHIAEVQTQLFQ